MKKLFGGIDLTWKKLIMFSVIIAFYTAVMVMLPITKDTSFRDISVYLDWWILFGIIIISNSKSPKDSALKCFIFFLISQPLIYLIQIVFSSASWHLFSYYKTWFILTLLCLPMGYIGYYIKKNNIISAIILLPMLILLTYLSLGYFNSMINDFPHHLLSFISCILIIILVVINLFDNIKLRIICFITVIISFIILIFINGGVANSKYETYKTIDNYGINFVGNIEISSFSGNTDGKAEVITSTDEIHSIKINGNKKDKYEFILKDESGKEYKFEYYYDENQDTVILNLR